MYVHVYTCTSTCIIDQLCSLNPTHVNKIVFCKKFLGCSGKKDDHHKILLRNYSIYLLKEIMEKMNK